MTANREVLKNLPGVDKILLNSEIIALIEQYNEYLVKFAIRESLKILRADPPGKINEQVVIKQIQNTLTSLTGRSLRKVINATGIIVHTNLGRAPFSPKIIEETSAILNGYNNLEYDLKKGERGSRHDHLTAKLKYLTGAEDVLLVNNNAAAVILVLRTFAKNREVIVSRGELIEIGGSFRIPEIMQASDCRMVEVGSTNKTHVTDYENAINPETAMLFKAHKSNYVIQGFTKEISLKEMVLLGKKHKIPVFYDMGSGMLKKTNLPVLSEEPNVFETLKEGVDLVSFSGDKLIGGAQAGIIAGKARYIKQLKKEPMVRALRVGKTTIAFMESALNFYLDEDSLLKHNGIFNMLHQTENQLNKKARMLSQGFKRLNIESTIVESKAYCGGGALPGESIPSKAVKIESEFASGKQRSRYFEKLFHELLNQPLPVVSVLKSGELYFDVLTLSEEELMKIPQILVKIIDVR